MTIPPGVYSPDQGSAPAVTPWTRDPEPRELCRCDHSRGMHNIEAARRVGACSLHGCDCEVFTLAALVWTERRHVREVTP